MSEMIERVKVAIAGELAQHNDWDKVARAAIEAMREPTEAMVQSGCTWFRQYDPDFDPLSDNINNAWQAMVDAALNPTQF